MLKIRIIRDEESNLLSVASFVATHGTEWLVETWDKKDQKQIVARFPFDPCDFADRAAARAMARGFMATYTDL